MLARLECRIVFSSVGVKSFKYFPCPVNPSAILPRPSLEICDYAFRLLRGVFGSFLPNDAKYAAEKCHRTCHKHVTGAFFEIRRSVTKRYRICGLAGFVTFGDATKKPATGRALFKYFFDFLGLIGGYGWTRTTDPSIMSAVL